jgi:hypothetical protein
MSPAFLIGPPGGNDLAMIITIVALLATLWLLAAVSKWIAGRIWKGKATMRNTVDELQALMSYALSRLESISEQESAVRPAEGKWSKKEILGHLIDSASNNHQRFVRAQLSSEIRLSEYSQDAWVRTQAYQAESWGTLLHLWKFYNLHLIHLVANIPQEKLLNICFIGDNPPASLEFIITDYVRHLRHHLEQIY